MRVFDSLVKHGMPLVPKPIVGHVARRYVAGVCPLQRLNALVKVLCSAKPVRKAISARA